MKFVSYVQINIEINIEFEPFWEYYTPSIITDFFNAFTGSQCEMWV